MTVHHFTAVDLAVTRGWQPIDTFPRDGTTVEVRDENGNVVAATWLVRNNQMVTSGLTGVPIHWRNPE